MQSFVNSNVAALAPEETAFAVWTRNGREDTSWTRNMRVPESFARVEQLHTLPSPGIRQFE